MKKDEERLKKIEEAVLCLAYFLEDVNHSDYAVVAKIADILRPKPLPKKQKKV